MRRVVSLFLPSWPTDRLRRQHAQAGAPHDGSRITSAGPLVTAISTGSRRLVASVDAAASRLGLRPGLTVAHAQAVVPGLVIAPADPEGDAKALRRLAVWCIRYCPLVALDPPDGILLDIGGAEHLFDGEAKLLADIIARLAEASIRAQGAIASTPGAACALARHAPGVCVASGEEAAALSPLPVSALRLAEKTADRLRRLGLSRIGQVMELPRAPLAQRFGPEIGKALDAALGRSRIAITPLDPPKILCERLIFAEPIATAEDIGRVIDQLARQLCAALESAGLGVRQLDLRLRRVEGMTEAVRIAIAAASRRTEHLAKLLRGKIEQIDPGFGIDEAMLLAGWTERLHPLQESHGLIGDEAESLDLSELVDRLAARLGGGSLYRATPVESDVPERSLRRLGPLAPPSTAVWPEAFPRPIRLLACPERIEAIASLPDAPPALFVWRKTRHRVRGSDGPERIFGEWWRADAEMDCVRDYYALEDESGARFWVFRDSTVNGAAEWFMHGLFG